MNYKYLIDQPELVLQHNFTTITPMFWLMLIKIVNVIRETTEQRGWTAALRTNALKAGERRHTN